MIISTMTIHTSVRRKIANQVIRYGQDYTPALLPKGVERGPVGKCFDWCIMQAINNPNLMYVEGLATAPDTGEWILHAWLTDGRQAFDPTWFAQLEKTKEEQPIPGRYVGIAMPTKLVAKFMLETGNQGVLYNQDLNPRIFREIMRHV